MREATGQPDWCSLAADPPTRLRTIREFANRVFDDENRAATWLSRASRNVAGGLCAVGAACQTPEGFREAVAELARLERAELEALGDPAARPFLPLELPAPPPS